MGEGEDLVSVAAVGLDVVAVAAVGLEVVAVAVAAVGLEQYRLANVTRLRGAALCGQGPTSMLPAGFHCP